MKTLVIQSNQFYQPYLELYVELNIPDHTTISAPYQYFNRPLNPV